MRRFLPAAALFLVTLSAFAQQKPRFNPDLTWNTLRAEYGILIPFETSVADQSTFLSLTYTHRFSRHWGWRAGAQYAPEHTDIRNYVGVPLAAVFRSGTYGFRERTQDAVVNSVEDVVWDGITGQGSDQMARDVVANFLFIVFRRFEGFVGVTPGYVFGNHSTPGTTLYGASDGEQTVSAIYEEGIRLNRRFTLTADAGLTLSVPLWRFSLDVTPAFHYLITNNFSEYRQEFDPRPAQPVGSTSFKSVPWQFTLSLGLSYLF
jgi:hypothetical protein